MSVHRTNIHMKRPSAHAIRATGSVELRSGASGLEWVNSTASTLGSKEFAPSCTDLIHLFLIAAYEMLATLC